MLRVRVEVVPHGRDDAAFVVDEVWATNDGSGKRADGRMIEGNYDIHDPGIGKSAGEAYYSGSVGRVEGIPRDEKHRTELARRILYVAQIARGDA